MPAAFYVVKVRQSFGGTSVKILQIQHLKTYMQGLYVLQKGGSTKGEYSFFRWEILKQK